MENINIDINAVDDAENTVINKSIETLQNTFLGQFRILKAILENQGNDLVRKSYNCNQYSICHNYTVTKAYYNPFQHEIHVSVKYNFLGEGKETGTDGFCIGRDCKGFHVYKKINVLGTEIKQVIEL